MKILQVNNVYDFGSTGRITRDIHHGLLENGIGSVVYYGRRYKSTEINANKICSELYGKIQNGIYQFTGIKYGGCFVSTNRLIKAIEKEKPDIVHLQCLNGHFVNVYRLLDFLKKAKIPTVLTLHAEFMYTGGCSHAFECNQWISPKGCGKSICPQYKKELKSELGDKSSKMWIKMKESFDNFDNIVIVSVSPWLKERASSSQILSGKCHKVILNGLDTDVFRYNEYDNLKDAREKLGFRHGEKIVFHATPFFDNDPNNIKGGFYVLKIAERMKNIHFLIAGSYDKSIIVPDNVTLLGPINSATRMAELYSMSDLTILTSKRETYSMVCAESLCCGTPVVGFKAGAPETISIKKFSSFVDFGNIDELEKEICRFLHSYNYEDSNTKTVISKKAKLLYMSTNMVEQYISLYHSLYDKN